MGDALGLDRGRVTVAAHDPAWARLFAEEAARLRAVLGDRVGVIEHVGSTSVPGLDAKPILDLMIAVHSLRDADGLVPLLRELGYAHKDDPEIPERLYFVRGSAERRTHHLSLAEPGTGWRRQQLRFRDLLRGDPRLAADYAALKHELAARHPGDRRAYAAGKQPFIEGVLAGADRR